MVVPVGSLLRLQVRQPFKPREPGGVDAAAVRAHGGAGGLL